MQFFVLIKLNRGTGLASIGLVLGGLLLLGCGGGEESGTATEAVAAQHPSAKSPPIHVPSGPPPTEVVVKEIVKGKGPAVPPITNQAQVKVKALYTAVKWNGELFEERQNPRDPYEVEFGANLNPGWELGLAGMRVGGRRELIVPVSASYGTGSDEALVYVVDLIGLERLGVENRAEREKQGLAMSKAEIAKLPPLKIPRPGPETPKQVKVVDLRKGSGATVTKEDDVLIRYFDVNYADARAGDLTGRYGPRWYRPEQMVKGLAANLVGMKVGGRRELILTPKLVYPRWQPSWGFPRFTIIYLVDLLGLKPAS